MDALLERGEIEPITRTDHDLAVDHAPLGELVTYRLDELGEVAGEWLLVAAAQHHLIAIAEHDRPESVPFRFKDKPTWHRVSERQRGHSPSQHRLDRGSDGQIHVPILPRAPRF